MDEMQIRTVEGVERFMSEPTGRQLKLQGSKDDVYKWIEHTLVRFHVNQRAKLTPRQRPILTPLNAV